jgi:molybdopterin synthase catalytic subunit
VHDAGGSDRSPGGDSWLLLTPDELSIDTAYRWVVDPSCGAVVVFSGTVRDHADGRPGVSLLDYEAYTEQVVPRLAQIADELRERWSQVTRIVLWHRTGPLTVTESSVVVAVAAAHRDQAFDAARFGIDTLKATVPIWKREVWDGGEDWGLAATELSEVSGAPGPSGRRHGDEV